MDAREVVKIARTTISLPDDLVARLEPLKERIIVSEICRTALEAKVVTYERVQNALSEENAMEKLVKRLQATRAKETQWSHSLGRDHGLTWAMVEASYGDLVEWSNAELLRSNFINRVPFPETAEAQEWYQSADETARYELQYFDHDAYARGLLEAAAEVWEKVRGKL
jgi:hypothetical protein